MSISTAPAGRVEAGQEAAGFATAGSIKTRPAVTTGPQTASG